ncbi:MAG: PAS domain S-box protein, partial [Actinomycetia bacterium]|nr:PAS domain S-box protein [Actinomycetes bacterium]
MEEKEKTKERLIKELAGLRRTISELSNSDIVSRFDIKLRYVFVNPTVECMTGISSRKFIGKTNRELGLPEEIVTLWERNIQKVFKTGRDIVIEFDFKTPIGIKNYLCHLIPEYSEKDLIESVLFTAHDISKHRRAEEVIEIAYSELNQIFNTAADGMRVIDKNFKVIRANKAFLTLSGLSEKEIIGKKCYKAFQSSYCHTSGCTLQRILTGEELVEYEVERERKDGIRISCILTATPFRRTDGELIGIVENFRDITKRKRDEEKIQLKTEDLSLINSLNTAINRGNSLNKIIQLLTEETKKIFSSKGATIYLLSKDGKHLVMQNIVLTKSVVKGIEKIISMKIPEIKIPLRKGSFYFKSLQKGRSRLINNSKTIQGMMAEFSESQTYKKLIPKIYKIIGISSVINVPLVADNEVIGLLDIYRDKPFTELDLQRFEAISGQITAAIKRKMIEEELRESEEQYHILFNRSNDAVFVYGLTKEGKPGKFIEVNDVSCRRLGYKREELLKLTPKDIVAHKKSNNILTIIKKLLVEKHVLYEQIHMAKDGRKILVEINAHLFELKKQPTILSIARDITKRKQIEENIKHLAFHDALTDLPNRLLFMDHLNIALAKARRNKEKIALMLLDLDQFKEIN